MATLRTQDELFDWLCAHDSLQGAFVQDVTPLPLGPGRESRENVRVVLRVQTDVATIAGEPCRMREIVLDAIDGSEFTLSASGFVPGHMTQGVPFAFPETGALRLLIEVPGALCLACSSICVSERETEDVVPRVFDDWGFSAAAKGAALPDPRGWLEIFRERRLSVAWRCWGGPSEDVATVPSNYQGWFLQHAELIDSNFGGLFFDSAIQAGPDFHIATQIRETMDLQAALARRSRPSPENAELLRVCGAYIGSLAAASVRCGNVLLTAAEWAEHVCAPSELTARAPNSGLQQTPVSRSLGRRS